MDESMSLIPVTAVCFTIFHGINVHDNGSTDQEKILQVNSNVHVY